MNKISWIIIASVLVVTGAVVFLFNNFFEISGWKILPKSISDLKTLNYELKESTQLGDTDKQIEIAEKLAQIRKNDNQSKIDLANVYLEKASFDFKEVEYGNKALTLANEVLANNPDNDQKFQTYLVIGYSYEVLQDYPQSLINYNKAIELKSNSFLGYVKRGHAYDLSGDLVKAEADYIKAYQLNNQSDMALYDLARIAQRKGDFYTAKDYAQKAIGVSTDAFVKSRSYELIGLAEIDSGNYQLAIDNFSKSIETYGKAKNSYVNRAYAQIILAHFSVTTDELRNKIQADITKALEIYPNSSFANVMQGILMQASGDKQKALEAYNKALSVVDNDIALGVSEKAEMKLRIKQSINTLGINK